MRAAVAALSNVHPVTVRRMCADGEILFQVRVGGQIRIPADRARRLPVGDPFP